MNRLKGIKSVFVSLEILLILFLNNSKALADSGFPLYQQPPYEKIGLQEAWEIMEIDKLDSQVIVAILDSGVDVNHPELIDSFWRNPVDGSIGYDFLDNDNLPVDEAEVGHGSFTAGIVHTVNPKAKLMILRTGTDVPNDEAVINGIKWAVDHGADIISMSFSCAESKRLRETIEYAHNNGVSIFSAAGNMMDDAWWFPAAYDEVISVTMSSALSNFGDWVDIEGSIGTGRTGVKSTYLNGGYITAGGTSASCPLVAGVASLLKYQDPELSNIEIKDLLLETAYKTNEYWTRAALQGAGIVKANESILVGKLYKQIKEFLKLFKDINHGNTIRKEYFKLEGIDLNDVIQHEELEKLTQEWFKISGFDNEEINQRFREEILEVLEDFWTGEISIDETEISLLAKSSKYLPENSSFDIASALFLRNLSPELVADTLRREDIYVVEKLLKRASVDIIQRIAEYLPSKYTAKILGQISALKLSRFDTQFLADVITDENTNLKDAAEISVKLNIKNIFRVTRCMLENNKEQRLNELKTQLDTMEYGKSVIKVIDMMEFVKGNHEITEDRIDDIINRFIRSSYPYTSEATDMFSLANPERIGNISCEVFEREPRYFYRFASLISGLLGDALVEIDFEKAVAFLEKYGGSKGIIRNMNPVIGCEFVKKLWPELSESIEWKMIDVGSKEYIESLKNKNTLIIKGRVVDSVTAEPIPSTVVIARTWGDEFSVLDYVTTTNLNGYFSLALPQTNNPEYAQYPIYSYWIGVSEIYGNEWIKIEEKFSHSEAKEINFGPMEGFTEGETSYVVDASGFNKIKFEENSDDNNIKMYGSPYAEDNLIYNGFIW